MKILIDNGHGENTGGKRSPDGRLREYAYVREIADAVCLELRKMGYDAERIVRETVDVPLQERARRVNAVCGKFGAGNVVLVSIHCNASGNGSAWMHARGWSAYTSKGNTRADKLSECLYAAASGILSGQKIRADHSDGDADWEENFYILRKTRCAAVLTENLFQDNEADVEFLLSSEGRRAIVDIHVKGIVKYLESEVYGKG